MDRVTVGSGVAGRWNKAGSHVLYTASSLALALLEMLVHFKRDQVPNYAWTFADIRDDLVESYPHDEVPEDSAEQGTQWLLKRGGKVAFSVPSVIVPERNILLNPTNTDFAAIHCGYPQALKIDPRLLRVP